MKSSRAQRWDLVVGAVASLIAIAGFLLSIALGNTALLMGSRALDHQTQTFLAVVAASFLALVGIKAGVRYRRYALHACLWSFEAWHHRAEVTVEAGTLGSS